MGSLRYSYRSSWHALHSLVGVLQGPDTTFDMK
jgi:hypothetical protein